MEEGMGQTWLMTGTAAVFWRFVEVEPERTPYLYLTESAETARSSTERGARFLMRGRWRGSAPAKLRHDNAARDRERGSIMKESVGERG